MVHGPSAVTHNTINGLLKRSDRFCRWLLNVPTPRLMLTRAEHKIWQSSSIRHSRIDAVELSGDLVALEATIVYSPNTKTHFGVKLSIDTGTEQNIALLAFFSVIRLFFSSLLSDTGRGPLQGVLKFNENL